MGYDGQDRLTSVTSSLYPGGATYAYDVLDNITRATVAGRDHVYWYDASNRLTNVLDGPGGPSVIGLGHDARGNVNNKNGHLFVFDHGNRLRTALGTEAYRYDAHGRRVRTSSTAGALYEMYSLDGKLLWQRDEQIGLRFQQVYLNGSVVAIRRRPVGAETEDIFYWHNDALGSQIATTVGTSVAQTTEHEPYGKMLNRTNNNRIGYTGHVMDQATGLIYMQQRYYDSQLGRFLSVDPVTAYSNPVTAYSNPVGAFNRYWYANNNPYRFADPDGRQSCERGSMKCHPSIASSVRTIGPVGDVSSSGGKSSISNVSTRDEPSTQKISSNGAFSHYKEGSGKPLRMAFNDIDTSRVKVADFPQVKALISGRANGSFGIDSRLPFSTSGDQAFFLGNITLRLQGSLSLSPKKYAFSGTLKSFDDTYDFNRSTHRGWIGEALTRWGAGQPGVPYEIQIRGSKVINEIGDR